jgi:hypothetical protein
VFNGGNRPAVLDGADSRAYAFRSSSAVGALLRALQFQRFKSPLQAGAIHSFGATGWTIENNRISNNAAVRLLPIRVLGCEQSSRLEWPGELGGPWQYILYEGKEICRASETTLIRQGRLPHPIPGTIITSLCGTQTRVRNGRSSLPP